MDVGSSKIVKNCQKSSKIVGRSLCCYIADLNFPAVFTLHTSHVILLAETETKVKNMSKAFKYMLETIKGHCEID